MGIRIRPLALRSEFDQAEEVQLSAWGGGDRGVTPKEVMIAIQDNGGLVLGAFDGDRVIGFALAICGYSDGRMYMYSHQTGVSKDYQSKGVGYLLKKEQREISLRRGFDLIAWTFDPIIAKNGHFNFRKLGVVARNYRVDYYGLMEDSINYGIPSDRFLCEWHITPARMRQVRSYRTQHLGDAYVAISKSGEEPRPVCRDWGVDLHVKKALVDIPSDIVRLKAEDMEEARRWRQATREVFDEYLRAGFVAVALLGRGQDYRYLLMKTRLPDNILRHGEPSLT